MMFALMLAASSLVALMLPAAIRSAESVPLWMLEALMLTALTCAAVNVPV